MYITSCVVAEFSLFIFGSIPSFLVTVSPYFDGLQIPLLKTESRAKCVPYFSAMCLAKLPFRELKPHDYSDMIISDNIYIISISSYLINVMLKIPIWMACKCPFSYRNSPKIQLCPGQIWGGSGPALVLRTRRVFLHGDRGYIHPANMSGVKKLEVNGDLLRKMIITCFILVYKIYISPSTGMHGLYRYVLFVRRCHPSKMFNTWAKPASFGK